MKRVTGQQARASQQTRSRLGWSGADRMRLELMAENRLPAEEIAKKLRRSEAAVRAEARKQRVMIAPAERQLSLTDKRRYGGIRVHPRRSIAKATAPMRPARSRPERPEQSESLF